MAEQVIFGSKKSQSILTDNMDFLRNCQSKKFDVGIVDPEYLNLSDNMKSNKQSTGGRLVKPGTSFEDFSGKPTEEYFYHLFRCTKNQIIFGGNYFTDIMDYSKFTETNDPRDIKPYLSSNNNWFVWYKQFADAKWSMAELAWVSYNKSIRVHREFPMNNVCDWHPTSKPDGVYNYLYKKYLNEGDSILDTNLGSGSSRRVAFALGHPFTGLEISEKFHKLENIDFKNFKIKNQMFLNEKDEFDFNLDDL